MGASIIINKRSSIGQCFVKIVRLQVARLLSDSDNCGTVYNQEILRGGGKRDNHRLRMCVKLFIEQAQRSKNFRIQNEITERGAVTKGKGQNSFTKRKTRECFQWNAYGSCSRGESFSFLHMPATGSRETTYKEVENTRIKPQASHG